jgi:hypothetical protein
VAKPIDIWKTKNQKAGFVPAFFISIIPKRVLWGKPEKKSSQK